jgi:hypothetical protein
VTSWQARVDDVAASTLLRPFDCDAEGLHSLTAGTGVWALERRKGARQPLRAVREAWRSSRKADFFVEPVDLAWSPLLREERFERILELEDDEPGFARRGLYPIAALDALRLSGAEVHGG